MKFLKSLIFLFSLFFYNGSYSSDKLPELSESSTEEKSTSREKQHSVALLERAYYRGDENLRTDSILSLKRLSEPSPPTQGKVLFSGEEPDLEKEKRVLQIDEREMAADESLSYPGTCIASIEVNFKNGLKNCGTGFLIAEHYVLTARHVISSKEEQVKSITCYFGRFENKIKDFCNVEGFTFIKSHNFKMINDVALLKLTRPMGKKLGYLNPRLLKPRSEKQTIIVQGYPAIYYEDNAKVKYLYNSCQFKSYSNNFIIKENYIFHTAQTSSGQSGSPILIMEPEKGKLLYYFVGMHLDGAEQVNENKTDSSPCIFRGIYSNRKFLIQLESLLDPLYKNVYFYSLENNEKKDKDFYNSLPFTSSSDISDIEPSLLEQGKSYLDKGNYKEALKTFKDAEKKGIPGASFELTTLYSKLAAMTPEPSQSFKYYLKAAERGNQAQDQYQVAEMYYKGIGTQQNSHEAFKWYSKAAAQSHAAAQNAVGDCYYYGYGTRVDVAKSREFYNMAKKNGYQSSGYCSVM